MTTTRKIIDEIAEIVGADKAKAVYDLVYGVDPSRVIVVDQQFEKINVDEKVLYRFFRDGQWGGWVTIDRAFSSEG